MLNLLVNTIFILAEDLYSTNPNNRKFLQLVLWIYTQKTASCKKKLRDCKMDYYEIGGSQEMVVTVTKILMMANQMNQFCE